MPTVKMTMLNTGGNIDMLITTVALNNSQLSNYSHGTDSLAGIVLSNDSSIGHVKMKTITGTGDYYVTPISTTTTQGSYDFEAASFPSETTLSHYASNVSNVYPNFYKYTGIGNRTKFTLTGPSSANASIILSYSNFTNFDTRYWSITSNQSNLSVYLASNNSTVDNSSTIHLAVVPTNGYTLNETYTLKTLSYPSETDIYRDTIVPSLSDSFQTVSLSNESSYVFSNDLSTGILYIQLINTGGDADFLLTSSQLALLDVANYLASPSSVSKYSYTTLTNSNTILQKIDVSANSINVNDPIHISVIPTTSTDAVFRVGVTDYSSEFSSSANSTLTGAIAYTGPGPISLPYYKSYVITDSGTYDYSISSLLGQCYLLLSRKQLTYMDVCMWYDGFTKSPSKTYDLSVPLLGAFAESNINLQTGSGSNEVHAVVIATLTVPTGGGGPNQAGYMFSIASPEVDMSIDTPYSSTLTNHSYLYYVVTVSADRYLFTMTNTGGNADMLITDQKLTSSDISIWQYNQTLGSLYNTPTSGTETYNTGVLSSTTTYHIVLTNMDVNNPSYVSLSYTSINLPVALAIGDIDTVSFLALSYKKYTFTNTTGNTLSQEFGIILGNGGLDIAISTTELTLSQIQNWSSSKPSGVSYISGTGRITKTDIANNQIIYITVIVTSGSPSYKLSPLSYSLTPLTITNTYTNSGNSGHLDLFNYTEGESSATESFVLDYSSLLSMVMTSYRLSDLDISALTDNFLYGTMTVPRVGTTVDSGYSQLTKKSINLSANQSVYITVPNTSSPYTLQRVFYPSETSVSLGSITTNTLSTAFTADYLKFTAGSTGTQDFEILADNADIPFFIVSTAAFSTVDFIMSSKYEYNNTNVIYHGTPDPTYFSTSMTTGDVLHIIIYRTSGSGNAYHFSPVTYDSPITLDDTNSSYDSGTYIRTTPISGYISINQYERNTYVFSPPSGFPNTQFTFTLTINSGTMAGVDVQYGSRRITNLEAVYESFNNKGTGDSPVTYVVTPQAGHSFYFTIIGEGSGTNKYSFSYSTISAVPGPMTAGTTYSNTLYFSGQMDFYSLAHRSNEDNLALTQSSASERLIVTDAYVTSYDVTQYLLNNTPIPNTSSSFPIISTSSVTISTMIPMTLLNVVVVATSNNSLSDAYSLAYTVTGGGGGGGPPGLPP